MKIVYGGNPKGADGLYKNPRLFLKPVEAATEVVVIGNFPKIVAAYQRLGVPVLSGPEGRAPADVPPMPAALAEQISAADTPVSDEKPTTEAIIAELRELQIAHDPLSSYSNLVAVLRKEKRRRARIAERSPPAPPAPPAPEAQPPAEDVSASAPVETPTE